MITYEKINLKMLGLCRCTAFTFIIYRRNISKLDYTTTQSVLECVLVKVGEVLFIKILI